MNVMTNRYKLKNTSVKPWPFNSVIIHEFYDKSAQKNTSVKPWPLSFRVATYTKTIISEKPQEILRNLVYRFTLIPDEPEQRGDTSLLLLNMPVFSPTFI